MGWKHILKFVTISLIPGSSLVPPGHELISGHHIYTLLHWLVVITVAFLSLGDEVSSGKS